MRRIVLSAWLAVSIATTAGAAEVSGRVAMPEVCSPGVSPAVVSLEPLDGSKGPAPVSGGSAEVALVDQRGLQFEPRVLAISLGRSLRFTNSDSETHSVHVVTPGFDFNQSMPAGQSRTWVPEKAGVARLACDVHSHMRGFVVVATSPWVLRCTREGRFRFSEVPDGQYVLNVWHEMGEPLRRPVTISGGRDVALPGLSLAVPTPAAGAGVTAPVEPWSEVIGRIGLALASSLDAAPRRGEFKKARKMAEDAYWGEFEASDMETAVRTHLGFARKGELEDQFFRVFSAVREVAEGRLAASELSDRSRMLLLGLVRAADELNRKGVTDRAHLFAHAPAAGPEGPADRSVASDPRAAPAALDKELGRVRALADRGEADDAASAMSDVYYASFEPIERFVAIHKPQDVPALEAEFNAIRGEVGAGLKGEALAARLEGLRGDVEAALGRSEALPSGTFGPAFAASLITILREGTEVILLLGMLVALAAKAGQAGALRAIRRGVVLAVVASAATAWALSRLVASAKGQAREMVEGLVMLSAAGVLFYVSYWLISQSESRRWLDFLKRRARRGIELGGPGTLALTAFLAVYREGAETALLYQAMIGAQGHSRPGLAGLGAGVAVGVALLAGIALAIRATSVRLPLRAFFKVTGVVLFAMAVVFAGNGVSELQASGILKTTPLAWLSWIGNGVPALGLYPTVQTLSVQAVLLVGALLALALMMLADESPARSAGPDPKSAPNPAAGVGIGA